ncbi:MAG: choice-of-anchor G family protein [Actinobacteria bacterium]|nr:choice-of-anchor G family protein [Actinomycetota bacterium]MBU1608175.1 choice-of-anchor G family protein [Actinomycetota bacterium]MBU2314877.1 choice-of-anchor G family protein [Actinomycetota bacterium]MBU2384848.1 choice-of-anchor G family protein [Actinomycetota bacterium]
MNSSTLTSGTTRAPRWRRWGAIGTSSAAIAALSLVGVASPAAAAEESGESYARGQLLSGTVAGVDLARLVAVAPAEARNAGDESRDAAADPLSATALDTVTVNAPNGVDLDIGSIIDLGGAGQYAEASANGESHASVGALTNRGAVELTDGPGTRGGDATIDLDGMLGGVDDSVLTDLDLRLEAVGAAATGTPEGAQGDYALAGATLAVSSPAIADLTSKVLAAIDPAEDALLSLGGSDGTIARALLPELNGLLGPVGGGIDVGVSVDSDLRSVVEPLLTSSFSSDAVSFDLEAGSVLIDLETLLGSELNALPPNTELLTADVLLPVLRGITTTVADLSDDVLDTVAAALDTVDVSVTADLSVLTAQEDRMEERCVEVPVELLGDDGVVDDLVDGLLGGLGGSGGLGGLGDEVDDLVGDVTELVCTLVPVALPDLRTSLDVDIHGELRQLLNGSASADATLTLLGAPVSVNVSALLGGLAANLDGLVLDHDDVIAEVEQKLQDGLVEPSVTGLLGDAGLGTALTDVLSVQVNVQEVGFDAVAGGDAFTQTAVRVTALGGAGGSGLATVNLAAATVGPNVSGTGGPGDPGDPGDPDCVEDCDGGGITPSGEGPGSLAYTGVNLALALLLLLGLALTGGALLWDAKRRKTAVSITG